MISTKDTKVTMFPPNSSHQRHPTTVHRIFQGLLGWQLILHLLIEFIIIHGWEEPAASLGDGLAIPGVDRTLRPLPQPRAGTAAQHLATAQLTRHGQRQEAQRRSWRRMERCPGGWRHQRAAGGRSGRSGEEEGRHGEAESQREGNIQ